MKLLNSFGPNPRAVRMFMLEKGIEMPFEDLDLLGGDNRAQCLKPRRDQFLQKWLAVKRGDLPAPMQGHDQGNGLG